MLNTNNTEAKYFGLWLRVALWKRRIKNKRKRDEDDRERERAKFKNKNRLIWVEDEHLWICSEEIAATATAVTSKRDFSGSMHLLRANCVSVTTMATYHTLKAIPCRKTSSR